MQARALLGADKIIGLTVRNESEMRLANALPRGIVDYIGVGPIYRSKHKQTAPIGLVNLRKMIAMSHYPVWAIGGIHPKCSTHPCNGCTVWVIDALHRRIMHRCWLRLRTPKKLRKQNPLIFCLTNRVTPMFVANALLSLGASPMMSECLEEVEELMRLSQALYVNLGTLNQPFLSLCDRAVRCAQSMHKPIVLDPVGAGSSKIRLDHAQHLMTYASIIKGNASEIMALSGKRVRALGVDSVHEVDAAHQAAIFLARTTGAVVVVTGAVDFITNGGQALTVTHGHPLMAKVTGMGCALGAIIAAFCAIGGDPWRMSHEAVSWVGVCGSRAAHVSEHPGHFKTAFLDSLYY